MTIQERLRRSNIIMLVIPILIAGILLILGFGGAIVLLESIYLPRMGLTLHELHNMGEELEPMFQGLKACVLLYTAVVFVALLATVVFTNLYLTRNLFAHIQKPLDALMQGVKRIEDGDLDSPIAYEEQDEFRMACDAVDAMAVRLKKSLTEQQREQQRKQELIAGRSHDLKKSADHHPGLYGGAAGGRCPGRTHPAAVFTDHLCKRNGLGGSCQSFV